MKEFKLGRSSGTITHTVYREIEVTVDYDFTPAAPDTWDEPGHAAAAEITSVKDSTGAEFALTDEEIEEIEEACIEDASEEQAGEYDHYIDGLIDAARDRAD